LTILTGFYLIGPNVLIVKTWDMETSHGVYTHGTRLGF